MRGQLVLLTTPMLVVALVAAADNNTRPIIHAKPALVEIGLQAPGRNLITLPSLEFPLLIEPGCEDVANVAYVSISVADTRETFAAADFIEKPSLEVMLQLPQGQMSPLAIDQFCTDESHTGSEHRMHIEDAFTAHVSLRCSGEGGQSVIYETLPLDVTVRCVIAGPETSDDVADDRPKDPSKDQESSFSLSRF